MLKQLFEGKNLQEALTLAEHTLEQKADEFTYEILQQEDPEVGIHASILVDSPKIMQNNFPQKEKEAVESWMQVISQALDVKNIRITHIYIEQDGDLYMHLESDDNALLIGHDADVLYAIQNLCQAMLFQKGFNIRVTIDIGRYKEEKRLQAMQNLVFLVQQTRKRKKEICSFQRYSPAERKKMHLIVENLRDITSYSKGDRYKKHFCVAMAHPRYSRS